MKSKQPWINWLKERQKTKGFKSSDTVESLLKEWKKTKDGKNSPLSLSAAQAYVSEAFEKEIPSNLKSKKSKDRYKIPLNKFKNQYTVINHKNRKDQ